MDYEKILPILQADYTRDSWKALIVELFEKVTFLTPPAPLSLTTQAKQEVAREILELGSFTLGDGTHFKIFEAELQPGKQIGNNRISLRNLVSTEIIPGFSDGALVVFYDKEQADWRFSFISKHYEREEGGTLNKRETHPKRYTYVLGHNQTCRTPAERFAALAQVVSPTISDVFKAFSVEAVSKEFFEDYVDSFRQFSDFLLTSKKYAKLFNINENKEDNEKLIRNFTKKLLGRIVFLYFLQKKGWLGVPEGKAWGKGNFNFMEDFYHSSSDKSKFYSHHLKNLFFDALNSKREADIFELTASRIPYLNGGLFENDFENADDIDFPRGLFDDVFAFLGRYNFTVDESNPHDQDVGIDPEMLGRIFESLLEDKKKLGTFYTPKNVVHYMCQESLYQYLCARLVPSDIPDTASLHNFIYKRIADNHVKDKSNIIEALLDKVKICDPAIGSGAFPMGMVHEILEAKYLLFYIHRGKQFDSYKIKLDIIQNSIYGVDFDLGAVEIARLRFWLSLIVDATEPKPLPNLDYKIMQGDSLYEEFEGIPLSGIAPAPYTATAVFEPDLFPDNYKIKQAELNFREETFNGIKNLIDSYYNEPDPKRKKFLHNKIDGLVHTHLEANIDAYQLELEHTKRKIEITLNAKKAQFSNKEKWEALKLKTIEWKEILRINKSLAEVDRKRIRLNEMIEKPERPYFLWSLFFGHVLNDAKDGGQEGFDIVIANPPYGVKVEDALKDSYELKNKDIYGVFIAFALDELLKDKGILTYVISDTWLTISSHYELREWVLGNTLKKIIRLHPDSFEATVNSCIMVVVKDEPGDSQVIAADLTNVSTRKQTAAFKNILENLEEFTGTYNTEFAVYRYPQSLISTNSNLPIFVASPKLFGLMQDVDPDLIEKEIGEGDEKKTIHVRQVELNGKTIELVRFGDIAEVRQGLATGDNHYYLYQNPAARGKYKNIEEYREFLLTDDDLEKIRTDENIRLKVIEKGIHQNKKEKGFDSERWFDGRYIVPYDKGGESDTDEGWLPNYYVPTNYFIDWSTTSIKRLKSYRIADRIRDRKEDKKITDSYKTTNAAVIRSPNLYFKNGISFSRTGVYAPTFRYSSSSSFDTEGSTIFIISEYDTNFAVGVLSSKLSKYFLKNIIGHTVHCQVEELINLPFYYLKMGDKEIKLIQDKVLSLRTNQQKNLRYDYLSNEQKEIDRLVYEMYGLNEDDINEVETWYARRYPKLARFADIRMEVTEEPVPDEIETIKALIAAGENRYVEFKSSLRFDLRKMSVEAHIEHSVLKTLAAFFNSDGGTLLIGVDDEKAILGLEADFNTFGKKANKLDAFQLHLDNLIGKNFGSHFMRLLKVSFPELEGQVICVMEVKDKSPEPVYLKDGDKDIFYIRRIASTKDLTTREAVEYVKAHWG